MKPCTLTINGFQSYRHDIPSMIHFDGLETAAIIGDTGSGKSSILEAMTFGLYGETSRGAKVIQNVMHDDSERFEIELEFDAGPPRGPRNRFRVRRAGRRTKKGQVVGDGASLWQISDDGVDSLAAEGVQRVTEAVEEAVGMNADAFLRTTILPQGRFARLLTEDDPKVRSTVLRQVWPTAELERARDRAASGTHTLSTLNEVVTHERGNHPDEPDTFEKELAEQTDTTRTREADAKRRLDAYDRAAYAAQTNGEEAERHFTHIYDLKDAASSWPGDSLTAAEAEFKKLESEFETEHQRWVAIDAAEPPGETPAETDRNNRIDDALATLTSTLGGIEPEISTREENLAKLAEAKEEHAAAASQAEHLGTIENELRRRSRAAAERLATLEEEHKNREERAASVRHARQAVRHWLRDTAAPLQQRLDHLQRSIEPNARRTAEEHAQAVDTAEAEFRTREAALEEARRLNHACEAASGAAPGDPCPVCSTLLPPDWTPPVDRSIEAALASLENARHRRNAAAQSSADARADLERVRTEMRTSEAGIRKAAEQARSAADAYFKANETNPESGTDAEGQLDRRLETSEREIAELKTSIDEARAANDACNAETADAMVQTTRLLERARALKNRASLYNQASAASADRIADAWKRWDAAASELQKLADNIQLPKRPGEDAATDRITAVTSEALEVLRTRTAERRLRAAALQKAVDEDGKARFEASRRAYNAKMRADDFRETRLVPLRDRAREMLKTLDTSARGLKIDLEGNRPDSFTANLERVIRQLKTLEDGRRADAHAARRRMLEAAGEAADDPNPRDALADRYVRAAGEHEAASRELAEFRRKKPILTALEELRHDISSRLHAVDELRRHLNEGSFPKYITLRRSARLLCHASRHLARMTDGQYGFRDPRDTRERWTVLDRTTGHDRSPAQLSGGEQFLASLALALGTIETVSRRGGTIRTLFVDEGFGSLDRQSLERAVQNLRTAVQPDHLIVLVSHIREVASAVADVIAVEKTAGGGSTARLLTPAERLKVIDPETDGAAGNLLAAH